MDGRPLEPLREGIGPFARYVPVVCRLEEHFDFVETIRTAGEALREAAVHQQAFSPEELGLGSLPVLFDFRELPAGRSAAGLRFSPLREAAVLERFRARLSVVARQGSSPWSSPPIPPSTPGRMPGSCWSAPRPCCARPSPRRTGRSASSRS